MERTEHILGGNELTSPLETCRQGKKDTRRKTTTTTTTTKWECEFRIVIFQNSLPVNCLYPPRILCFHHFTMFPAIMLLFGWSCALIDPF